MVAFSSFSPISSEMTWPPVRTARSWSMALRRSPKPGALTATDVKVPADLVHHQGGQRLALDVLGDDQQRLARLHDLLEHGHEVVDGARSSGWRSGCSGSSRTASWRSGSVTKYGDR